MKKLTKRDLTKSSIPIPGYQTKAYILQIDGILVSIVKWSSEWYKGYYEVFSWNQLFDDVERFKTLKELLNWLEQFRKEQNG